jgi:hypothetical protein
MTTRRRAGIAAVVLALAAVFAADLAAQKQPGEKPFFRGWTGTVRREQHIEYTCKSTVPGVKDRTGWLVGPMLLGRESGRQPSVAAKKASAFCTSRVARVRWASDMVPSSPTHRPLFCRRAK